MQCMNAKPSQRYAASSWLAASSRSSFLRSSSRRTRTSSRSAVKLAQTFCASGPSIPSPLRGRRESEMRWRCITKQLKETHERRKRMIEEWCAGRTGRGKAEARVLRRVPACSRRSRARCRGSACRQLKQNEPSEHGTDVEEERLTLEVRPHMRHNAQRRRHLRRQDIWRRRRR